MLNQVFRSMLLPFIVTKAQIDNLKIDIPWSNLNHQPIKTQLSRLHLVLEYRQFEDLEELFQTSKSKDFQPKYPHLLLIPFSLSIQNEMRKFKEIDEKLIKKYIKKLLLNIEFRIQDVALEIILLHPFRKELKFFFREFNSKCVDLVKSNNPDDSDYFHRIFELHQIDFRFRSFSDDIEQNLTSLDLLKGSIIVAKVFLYLCTLIKDRISFNYSA
jgi:hypothetical protein